MQMPWAELNELDQYADIEEARREMMMIRSAHSMRWDTADREHYIQGLEERIRATESETERLHREKGRKQAERLNMLIMQNF